MPKMFSRWQGVLLAGVIVSLAVPATGLAQRRRTTRRTTPTTTQPTAPAQQQPAQAQPSATPAATQPQASAPQPQRKPESPQAAGTTAQKPKETKGTWKLKVSTAQPFMYSLKADQARVSEIAAELSRKLDVPVKLSGVMEKARVTLDFAGVPLEGALRLIAPQPYIDYEISGEYGTQKPVAVYLYALNEAPPAKPKSCAAIQRRS